MKILITDWAARQFNPPPSKTTLYTWAKSGQIVPAPIKVGNRWYVDEQAEYVPYSTGAVGLSERARRILQCQPESALSA